jgi:hypothetical protein
MIFYENCVVLLFEYCCLACGILLFETLSTAVVLLFACLACTAV